MSEAATILPSVVAISMLAVVSLCGTTVLPQGWRRKSMMAVCVLELMIAAMLMTLLVV